VFKKRIIFLLLFFTGLFLIIFPLVHKEIPPKTSSKENTKVNIKVATATMVPSPTPLRPDSHRDYAGQAPTLAPTPTPTPFSRCYIGIRRGKRQRQHRPQPQRPKHCKLVFRLTVEIIFRLTSTKAITSAMFYLKL